MHQRREDMVRMLSNKSCTPYQIATNADGRRAESPPALSHQRRRRGACNVRLIVSGSSPDVVQANVSWWSEPWHCRVDLPEVVPATTSRVHTWTVMRPLGWISSWPNSRLWQSRIGGLTCHSIREAPVDRRDARRMHGNIDRQTDRRTDRVVRGVRGMEYVVGAGLHSQQAMYRDATK
ncbi:uncharacterized protein K452DRAFT_61408 [Aplosporella prunicola CBS 121167]|uniref:Uncharacterized protein n=1 Tax=Aplosporella prunicola CBS 121167 TaxID=1176127 RepID=A0A6A6B8B3_9PEZI|nr:uncharacterized protein K452DRAFT_61408 [Aplosporella prunicola CBS 121167]KAF2139505.1 hypothetical protein K452DRAFT_61408 [Aplosporella prunicola CBS 121167]